jgi:hypothetical protein
MHLIRQIVECFGDVPDPDQHALPLLNDDIPQLSAAIKHALCAPEDNKGEKTCRLFFSGCQALQSFMKMRITNDKAVLKRIFRPVVPENLPMFASHEKLPISVITASSGYEEVYSDIRANLLLHLGQLLTLGNVPASEVHLWTLVHVDKSVLGAHAASLAIDGARFVLNEGLSFGGRKSEGDLRLGKFDPCYLTSWTEIDDSVKAALVCKWSKLAAIAVSFLTQALESSDDTEKVESWLRAIVPFLFAGFEEAIWARNTGRGEHSSTDWGNSINAAEVATGCLTGIAALSANPKTLALDSEWQSQVESSLSAISKSIFEPILSGKSKLHYLESEMELIETSCALLLHLTKNGTTKPDEDSSLQYAILRPLSIFLGEGVSIASRESSMIVSTCLTAAAKMYSRQSAPANLAQALMNVTLKISAGKHLPSEVQAANRDLLRECLSGDTMTIMEHSEIALRLAESEDWEGWSVAVKAREGAAAQASLNVVQENLLACINVEGRMPLLRSLQVLLQASPPPSDFVGRIVSSTIPEALVVFQAYATFNVPADLRVHRSSVCADGMKIALVAIQQLSNDGSTEDDIAQFLHSLFHALIASIRYNGLPNSPIPHPGSSDPAIGRMCAQAITHIARVAAAPFKSCMALMHETDRAVLEFAVRAEMSGYISATTEAASKKLSLKGFKK